MNVQCLDFVPSHWRLDTQGPCFYASSTPKYVIDCLTKKRYLNAKPSQIRLNHLAMVIITPVLHIWNALGEILHRFINGSYFLLTGRSVSMEYSFSSRMQTIQTFAKELFRLVILPAYICALEASLLYGMVFPLNGRKIYAALLRLYFRNPVFPPCYQPDPTHHGLGGDINRQDAI